MTLGQYARKIGMERGLTYDEINKLIDQIDHSNRILDRDDEPHNYEEKTKINLQIVNEMIDDILEARGKTRNDEDEER